MRLALAALVALSGLAQAAPESTPAYPFAFEEVDAGAGVHVFIDTPGHAIVSGNSVVIEGARGLVVVDTGQHPRLTRMMIERIRAITAKPVLYVVNTHWHNDHVAGNALYAGAYPGARFVAHSFTAAMLEQEIAPYAHGGCTRFLERESAPLRAMVDSGKSADGKAIPAARLARLGEVVVDADAGGAECREFDFRGADIAFDERVTLKLGDRDVQVLFLGRANTAGDAIVYLPEARMVITGDVLVHPFPFATQSYIHEWAAVLRRIEAMDADVIIPGHGPVMRDKQYLHLVGDLMESIDAQARKAWRPGMALEDLRAHVDLAGYRARFAGDSAFIGANFDAMAHSAVDRAWQELAGRLEAEGLPRG
ncbi:MAG TPA: MBL fold metallo-hydrolase [Usitatibacter sp.]|jgi:glyoxylase-like metal-dependent hydrolase (beta-lactamase superfamily II)|nr:MBL fold metallo-hydrolase [Usitatibacter sp.]